MKTTGELVIDLLDELDKILDDVSEPAQPFLEGYELYDMLKRCRIELQNNQLKISAFRSRHNADIDDLNKLRSIIKKRIY